MKIDLSVVTPVYNEAKTLPELYRRLKLVLKKLGCRYEVIFVDDGSSDQSLALLKKFRGRDKNIKIISFSRNFGHLPAVSAGLKHISGEKIVVMDADLQDPPEVITKMYALAKKGYDVVYGVKIKRKEGPFKRFLFASFYRILNGISMYKMPLDAGAFSLMNKKIVVIISELSEKHKFFSGLRSWVGFSQIGVTYERDARFAGNPKSLSKLFEMALDGLLSFSYLPLRLASLLGFVCALAAFLSIIIVIILRTFFNIGIIGWASTMSAILLVGGIQLITAGIIGEYLARIYDEVKNRPEYIIGKKVGFPKKGKN